MRPVCGHEVDRFHGPQGDHESRSGVRRPSHRLIAPAEKPQNAWLVRSVQIMPSQFLGMKM